jgi:hypothetical protein
MPESQGVCAAGFGQYEPAAQGVLAADPAGQYAPGEQSVASVPFAQKYSGGHGTGNARLPRPPSSTSDMHVVPGGQRTDSFARGQYVPSGHGSRSVEPAGQYHPTSQYTIDVSEQTLPAGHSSGSVRSLSTEQ